MHLETANSDFVSEPVISVALMLIMGLGSGLIYGITSRDFSETFLRIFMMSASKIPDVFMLVGLTTLVNGLLPKAVSGLSWTMWVLFAGLELLWEGKYS